MNWNSNDKGRFEEKITISVILLILIPISISAFGHEAKVDNEPLALEESYLEYENIDPIKVEGDEGFSEDYWEGNGTEEDPYELKKNYSINATDHEYGIKMVGISDHFTIENVEIHGASGDMGAGIHFFSIENGRVLNCDLYNNRVGIYTEQIGSAYQSTIERNQITNNQYGLFYDEASGDLIKNNVISNNSELGFYGEFSVSENEIINNTFSNNGESGIKLENVSPNNLIQGNHILGNSDTGISLIDWTTRNELTENKIENNEHGIHIRNSDSNEIWRNQFINNTNQATDDDENNWNRGNPEKGDEGGNYWSDWEEQGIQDRGNGIGDSEYQIPGGDNQDNYPWVTSEMSLYSVDRFEVSVDNTTAGTSPIIEILEAYDEGDNLLEDEYSLQIEVNDKVLTEDLTFKNGSVNYTYEELTDAGEYSAEVTIEGVTGTDTFFIEASDPDSTNIKPEADQTIKAGETLNFSAEVYDKHDNLITNDPKDFIWENASKGTFNKTTTGEYEILAVYKQNETFTTETVKVNVNTADVHSIELETSPEIEIKAGEILEFTAEAYDEYNNLITKDPNDFIWENASDGQFHETNASVYQVIAIFEGKEVISSKPTNVTVKPSQVDSVELEDTADITITAGEVIEFKAKAYDEYNNLITNDPKDFIWENASKGTFNKTTTGEYRVTATFEESVVSEPVNVTVKKSDAGYVELEALSETEITAGGNIEFIAEAYDDQNNLITNDPNDFIWENSSKGKFNKTTAGEYRVTATFEGEETIVSAPSNVIVKAGEAVSVKLDIPQNTNITAGEVLEFKIKAYDEYKNLITNDPKDFIWENASKGTFNKTTVGEYKVTATFEEGVVSTPSKVTIKPAAVRSVKLEITSETNITAGDEVEFHAKAYDRYGNLVTKDSQNFTWKNASNGTFNETTTGEYEVRVFYEGEENFTSEPINLSVEANKAHSVELKDPSTTVLDPGDVLEFDAKAYDRYDNLIEEDDENFTWKNASNGTFKETTAGEYEVRATYHEEKGEVTSEGITIAVQTADLHDFDLSVEDITAGQRPKIEVVYMRDKFGNPLEGEYEVEMSIGGDTKLANLTFTEGYSDYYHEEITLADQYSIKVDIDGINRSENFQVKPGHPAYIDIDAQNKTIVAGNNVSYTSTAYDEWNNRIGKVNEEADWSIEKGAGGYWNESKYESENHGVWNVTVSYTYGNKDLTNDSTLTVLPKVEGFRYSGLNTIIFEQNLDYNLKWNLTENHVISYYEVMAGGSSDELETINTETKNESYLYQFEDGETVHFKIIGRDEKGEEVEAIDFEVTVDLIKLEVEEREKKIFSIDMLEERKDGVNVTWFVDGENRETGDVFIPDLGPGKYNITAEVSGKEHVTELTYELHIEDEESEEDSSIIHTIIGLVALFILGIFGVTYMKSKKDTESEDEFHFYEERRSNNRSEQNKKGIESKDRMTKSDKKSTPPPPPVLTSQSNEKNIESNTSQNGIDNELVIQTFENVEKGTKKQIYAELTGKGGEEIKVEKLEDRIESLVQEEKLTMQPRKDGDTLYIWNDSKQQPN